jgi:hypothetical protein
MTAAHPRLALYGFHRGPNGIGRVICNLANGVVRHDVAVDLLVGHAATAALALRAGAVRVVTLGAHRGSEAVARLADYLQRERPTALLGNREWANRQMLAARRRSAVPVRLAFRVGSPPSAGLARRHWPSRLWHRARLRHTYRQADRVIAISAGVATDVLALTGLPADGNLTGLTLDGTCRVGVFSQPMKATISEVGGKYQGQFLDGAEGKGLDIVSGAVTGDRVVMGINRKKLNGAMVARLHNDSALNITISVKVEDRMIPVIGLKLNRQAEAYAGAIKN